MDYEWEIEHSNLDSLSYEDLQEIICKKIANVIIRTENLNCTIWIIWKNAILKEY